MKVIICEDDVRQGKFLHSTILNYSLFQETDIDLVLSAANPEEVLIYLDTHKADCYFLDIEFNTNKNGLDLALEIRRKDPLATIIFVTTYSDKLKLTFTYKVAALDFIVKDDPNIEESIINALIAAYKRYKQINLKDNDLYFQLKIGSFIKNIRFDNIYYFETASSAHKVRLKEKNGLYEFYGNLKDIMENLDGRFIRCHRSYIVNLQHITNIDKKKHNLTMSDESTCYVSYKMSKELQKQFQTYHDVKVRL